MAADFKRLVDLSFDRISETYDAMRGGERRGRAIAEHLLTGLAPGSVLEVGVGTGVVARALQDAGRSVIGVDIAPLMLAQARRRCGAVVAAGDAARLPFADASFDNALLVWVLNAVADRSRTLAEAARVLRPGGRCLVVPTNRFAGSDPMRELIEEVRLRVRPNRVDAYGAERLASEAAPGLRLHGMLPGERYSYDATPEADAQRLEARDTSWLWDLSDAEWQAEIVPLLARLRALPPGPYPRNSEVEIFVFERA